MLLRASKWMVLLFWIEKRLLSIDKSYFVGPVNLEPFGNLLSARIRLIRLPITSVATYSYLLLGGLRHPLHLVWACLKWEES